MLLLTDLLKSHGYEVEGVDDGEKGLIKAKQNKPDLIILDIQMPVMNGFTFLETIKKDSLLQNIKIIVVTSYAMKGDKEKILSLGAHEYVSKPINTRLFVTIVKKLIS